MSSDDDAHWMAQALAHARAALQAGEVPVGAVVVKDGALVGAGRNDPVARHDPTAHAEVNALRAAAAALGNYRLEDCTLYVTLEPCAMCAGAMLHARVARVVYGATDPKTGAAGSVLDLFAAPQLNHQTQVAGGVCAAECAELLQGFFRERREQARALAQPLRDDALRTPEARFAGLRASPLAARQLSELPALQGWRMHYLDSAPDDRQGRAVVCLHGTGQWSGLQGELLAALERAGCPRVLAPDLIGFGRSDKPKREAVHTLDWHAQVLLQWLEHLGLGEVVLLCNESLAPLGQALAAAAPTRILALQTVPEQAAPPSAEAAWRAPFPDRGYEAALRALGQPGHARAPDPACVDAIAREAMGYFAAT